MAFAEQHGIKVPTTRAKPYSTDGNLLHISFEGGLLEDPWKEPPDDMFNMTVSPQDAPDQAEIIEITFKQGDPVAINDKNMSPAELLKELNKQVTVIVVSHDLSIILEYASKVAHINKTLTFHDLSSMKKEFNTTNHFCEVELLQMMGKCQ